MAWIILIIGGCFEVVGVASINRWVNKKNIKHMVELVITFALSFALLSYAMNTIPMGTAYAVWTSIGTAGSAIVGMFFFGDAKSVRRILFITLIIAATVGLKLIS
ncbi:Quaternary ammonium compound-resistance protein SugE [Brachybacterium faecium]|nr:Quaternary ammonium compound-resistance protein SugE [Brachybacterium faecium]